jgi:hypothetical protein
MTLEVFALETVFDEILRSNSCASPRLLNLAMFFIALWSRTEMCSEPGAENGLRIHRGKTARAT